MDEPEGDGPNRTCISTRAVLPVEQLIRFVAAPDGSVVPDLKGKLPGRGVWVTARMDAVADAVHKKAFARTLKQPVTAAADLADLVGRLLRRDALQALSLANKAGTVIAGSAKIEGAASRGFAALLHASGASEAGVEKLERAVRSRRRDGPVIPSIRLFTADELSLSLGREHVIHAALVAGAPSGNFLKRARAADRYWRTDPAPASPPGHPAREGVGNCISTEDSDPDE
jgi:predicted RNA-binding protein YlxR (DUF448 family)